jgi:hypothetical protein
MIGSCKRRDDVDSMVRRGCWPEGCDGELRAHVESCRDCRERILLTQSFQSARAESMAIAEVRPGSSFLLWWKAELRRRDVALNQASRPMMLAHGFALAVSVIAAVVLVVLMRGPILDWLAPGMWKMSTGVGADMLALWGEFGAGRLMLMASGLAAVVLAGGVVYVASDR